MAAADRAAVLTDPLHRLPEIARIRVVATTATYAQEKQTTTADGRKSQRDAALAAGCTSVLLELLNYSIPHSLNFWLTRSRVSSSIRTNVGQPR
jgi:hypothetical protein